MTLLWIALAFLAGWLTGEIHAAAIKDALFDRFRLRRLNRTLKNLREDARNLMRLVVCLKALDTVTPVLELIAGSRAVPAFRAQAALQCIKDARKYVGENGDEN